MFEYLIGTIEDLRDNVCVLDVNSVGYLLYVSDNTKSNLSIGNRAKLFTELLIRENLWQMYGFIDESERSWFDLLTTVQGVGARYAINILSKVHYSDLPFVISNKRKDMLSAADGIGDKIATRILNELERKIPASTNSIVSTSTMNSDINNNITNDVYSALINLGFKPNEIKSAISNVQEVRDFEQMLRDCLNLIRK